jgi:hypothetical protein
VLFLVTIGVVRARDAGAVKPLLVVHASTAAQVKEFSRAVEVSLLSALAGLYEVGTRLTARYCFEDMHVS